MKIRGIANQQSSRFAPVCDLELNFDLEAPEVRGLWISWNFQSLCTPRHSRIACITDILIAFDLPPICPWHHRGNFPRDGKGIRLEATDTVLPPSFVPRLGPSDPRLFPCSTGVRYYRVPVFHLLPHPIVPFLLPAMPIFLRSHGLRPAFVAIFRPRFHLFFFLFREEKDRTKLLEFSISRSK